MADARKVVWGELRAATQFEAADLATYSPRLKSLRTPSSSPCNHLTWLVSTVFCFMNLESIFQPCPYVFPPSALFTTILTRPAHCWFQVDLQRQCLPRHPRRSALRKTVKGYTLWFWFFNHVCHVDVSSATYPMLGCGVVACRIFMFHWGTMQKHCADTCTSLICRFPVCCCHAT